jgi:hypothetical protein
MQQNRLRPLMVSGNVFFCDFRRAPSALAPTAPLTGTTSDLRQAAEILQEACADLVAGAPVLVRRTELQASDLVNIAGMIDELAFKAHIIALDNALALDPAGVGELRRAMLDAAAVTGELQSCMSGAIGVLESLRDSLRATASRALLIGDSVTCLVEGGDIGVAPGFSPAR